MKRTQTRRLTLAAMMGAVSFVLMYFSFSVPVLSPFADFDLSALPDLIGGFVLGPVGAVEIIAVKVLLKLVFKGTSSMFTGRSFCSAQPMPCPPCCIIKSTEPSAARPSVWCLARFAA